MPAATPNPRRRWYQFSLRTLLVGMLLLCVVGGWVAIRMQQASRNRQRVAAVEEALAAIDTLGGYSGDKRETLRPRTWLEEVFDDPGDADDPTEVTHVDWVVLSETKATDDDLAHVEPLTGLTELRVSKTPITGAGLAHVTSLHDLEHLDASYTQVGDEGLRHLTGLAHLRVLFLKNTRVTDAGLSHLKGLTQIEQLSLSNTQVGDAGLRSLAGMHNLGWLFLGDTQVSDAGLEHLKGLPNLRLLELRGTHVTEEGADELHRKLPGCVIFRGDWPDFL